MSRPKMKLGEWGRIAVTGFAYDEHGDLKPVGSGARKADKWRARARVRDLGGVIRPVERWADTKAAAPRVLTEALRERVTPAPSDAVIRPDSPVKDAAAVWLGEMRENSRLSINTRKVYASSLNRHVIGTKDHPSSLANLTLREVKVVGIERWLRAIGKASGPDAMKTARSVLR